MTRHLSRGRYGKLLLGADAGEESPSAFRNASGEISAEWWCICQMIDEEETALKSGK